MAKAPSVASDEQQVEENEAQEAAEAVESIASMRARAEKKARLQKLLAPIIAIGITAVGTGAYYIFKDHSDALTERLAVASPPVYVDIPTLTVNMETNNGQTRYLRVRVVVQVKNMRVAEDLNARSAELNDSFNMFFREIRPEDMVGAQGAFRIKEELLRRTAEIVGAENIRDVLIQELVQQ